MADAYLLTNGGSGEDGDEWLLHSIHATKEGAEAAKTEWYREVEEWEIEGSLLTDAEREAIIDARCAFLNDAAEADELADQEWWASKRRQQAASLQSLLDRLG